MLFTSKPLANIFLPIWPYKQPFPFFFIIDIFTNIFSAIGPFEYPVTMHPIFFPRTFIFSLNLAKYKLQTLLYYFSWIHQYNVRHQPIKTILAHFFRLSCTFLYILHHQATLLHLHHLTCHLSILLYILHHLYANISLSHDFYDISILLHKYRHWHELIYHFQLLSHWSKTHNKLIRHFILIFLYHIFYLRTIRQYK